MAILYRWFEVDPVFSDAVTTIEVTKQITRYIVR